jgi:hypothetical protein
LHGGDADAQSRERAWARCDGERIHVRKREPRVCEQSNEIAGQPLRLRLRAVARLLAQYDIVARHRAARRSRRGVKSQDQHQSES